MVQKTNEYENRIISMIDNIVLFLSGDRGINILNHLLQEGRNVTTVVVPEESVFWKISEKYSKQYLIRSTQINCNNIVHLLKSLNPDVFIVAGFPTIFKQAILNIPKFGVLNLHGGPLPKYRGGSPLNWQIINGEKQIGISIIAMNEGIDTGDILAQDFFDLELTDDIHTVHQKANSRFIKLVSDTLVRLEHNQINRKKQNEDEAQYWIQRTEQDGMINWNEMTARQVINLIRALKTPYPSAFTYNKQKIFLYDAALPSKIIKGKPGKVVFLQNSGPYIICKDRAIFILSSSEKLKNGIYLTSQFLENKIYETVPI